MINDSDWTSMIVIGHCRGIAELIDPGELKVVGGAPARTLPIRMRMRSLVVQRPHDCY